MVYGCRILPLLDVVRLGPSFLCVILSWCLLTAVVYCYDLWVYDAVCSLLYCVTGLSSGLFLFVPEGVVSVANGHVGIVPCHVQRGAAIQYF